jgi:signal transduction histidine kinase
VIHEFPGRHEETSFGNIVTYPLKDQDGKIFKIIEIWRDITEEISRRWEERARVLKADINKMVQEDRMISLGKLAASCVHEINNPIQGLLTFSDLMQALLAEKTPTPADLEKFEEYLSLMSRELERCGSIISGLLSFSREASLEYKHVSFNEVLDAVLTLTRHKLELQNIELVTDLDPGLILMRGDPNQLQQAVLNLVFNAVEAMPEGGRLKIRTRREPKARRFRIEISDTGCGIPDQHLNHIFDPFFTTKKEGEGTGLGLSIVHGITKNHGGQIAVRNSADGGTAFVLHFPMLEQGAEVKPVGESP